MQLLNNYRIGNVVPTTKRHTVFAERNSPICCTACIREMNDTLTRIYNRIDFNTKLRSTALNA